MSRDKDSLVIRLNSIITNDPCALCGARTDPSGVDLMTEDSRLVCVPCGREHAPELQGLIDLANAASAYAEIGRWQMEHGATSSPPPY